MNERGVAVAQDVIKHLNTLQLTRGTYCRGKLPDLQPEQSLQERVDEATKACRVCLLGACVLSKARVFNALTPQQAGFYAGNEIPPQLLADRGEVTRALEDVFDPLTMLYMESAFELRDMTEAEDDDLEYQQELVFGAICFGARHARLQERVRAVMEEAIAQGGVWRPAPATETEADQAVRALRWAEASKVSG